MRSTAPKDAAELEALETREWLESLDYVLQSGGPARVGRLLAIEELEEMTKGLPRAEAYRLIAERVRHEVVNLRDRTSVPFDAGAVHDQWQAERRLWLKK